MIRLLALALLAAAPAAVEPPTAVERALTIGRTSSERLAPDIRLAPGDPPILRFRYLDGKRRHRFGDLNLVMDDAGH